MSYVAAIVAAACFGIGLRLLGVVTVARRVVATSRTAADSMRNSALSDIDKEQTVQKASLSLFGDFFSIVGRGAGALGMSVLPLLAFQAVGLVSVSTVAHLLATWQGIAVTSAVMVAGYAVKVKP